MSSRLTRTAMPSPISRTGCASRPLRAGRRPRRCAALRAREAAGTGDGGQIIVEGAPVSTGREARVTEAGDYRFFAGWRSDPFFFDVQGALNNLQFTGDDFFADKDVCSIVLEVPNSALGSKKVGLWARTLVRTARAGAGSRQTAARGPANSLPCRRGESCLPRRRAGGRCPFRRRLRARAGARGWVYAGGSKAGGKDTAAGPPAYDPTRPASFPDNGRALTDDVSDVFLAILTNGKVTEDKVGPHGDLLAEFPYLGPPHKA